ncbi:MAG: hypothetical protein A2Y00_10075 [Omnitrophica WOR_2 bacterium GWF2_43_52]|nr:MAG: hypothetical protein A2062_07010 [Omnitrophica WOR_2 bacterium GWA2_44_7]OGX15818.1 MAG: hypothetical protein A2Y01_02540 [Omnitrophica WOR_2 bacterium GWC2_44_8]OGX21577.1 MAG: hypothetical protein A2Y00_10075 [Omnitrophica WOR_2 bacterium GWF2_43_52]HAH19463.1 hypothetical protein [Candidatus Omnitrophota bacterium]HBG63834.1 hypothetical protein [Candidatus Omnitrophota bacterium]
MRNRIVLIVIFFLAVGIAGAFFIFRPRVSSTGNSPVAAHTSVQSLLKEAQAMEQKGDLVAIKAAYTKLINDFPGHKDVNAWQKRLDEVNLKIILSPLIVTGVSQSYDVQPLDSLVKIAKQFTTTVELIKRSNNLTSDRITPGQKLKIWTAKFSVFVDKSQNILVLKSNDEIVKIYNVATGTSNSTPVGNFKITTKLVNPTWYKAGAVVPADSPENILGTRWLGFDIASYGIHGTTDPGSIGKQATAGCVRMHNAEVEELYSLLPVGTEVIIVD